jgi:archaemetzincin
MATITLIPIAPINLDVVQSIVRPVTEAFNVPVKIHVEATFKADCAYNISRGQYNSSELIGELLTRFPNHEGKIIGITSVDLFIPILTFVFGEAQLNGTAAVMSTSRLEESFYGMTENRELYIERTIKETVHELGHTFGLLHCKNQECAMHSSTSVEEIDLKGTHLCEQCYSEIIL